MSESLSSPEGNVPDAPVSLSDSSSKADWLKKVLQGLKPETIVAMTTGRLATREATSAKILGWSEDAANSAKGAGDSKAHAVSAHGPGTDQMPRLVTGRRADEVAEEDAKGATPAATVAMEDGTEMPAWNTVGNDPSNVSSRFGSAVDMLRSMEEAFAQAALLQSRIAAENKELDKEAMKVKEVKDAADALGEARKQEAAARLAAKKAKEALEAPPPDIAAEEMEKLQQEASKQLAAYQLAADAVAAAIKTLRAEKEKVAPGKRSSIGEDRQKIVVEPGGIIGQSFKVGDDQATLKTGEALTPETMQARQKSVVQSDTIKTATFILDPGKIKDDLGVTRDAGFQVQTAFPSTGEAAQRGVSEEDFTKIRSRETETAKLQPAKDEVVAAEAAKVAKTSEREAKKAEAAQLRADRDASKSDMEELDPTFRSKEDNDEFLQNHPTIKTREKQDEAFAEAKKRFEKAKEDIKAADKREAELAEEEKQALQRVARAKSGLEKQTAAMEKKLAAEGGQVDAVALKAVVDATEEAAAGIGALREALAKAEKAVNEAPATLGKTDLDALKRQVSALKSQERATVRQVSEARERQLASLKAAAAAAQENLAAKTREKEKAEQAANQAAGQVVPPGDKPTRASFSDGPVQKQENEFGKAMIAWDKANTKYNNAVKTRDEKDLALQAAILALTTATSDAEAAAQAVVALEAKIAGGVV